MTITAHCLVRNEENFIWYALQSVLPYVDKILVWDTGSTDKTVEIIKLINSPKIEFKEKGEVNKHTHTLLRQEMLAQTTTDWFMLLDGDEVWPASQIEYVTKELVSLPPSVKAVLVNFILCVGDIYHHSSWGGWGYSWGLQASVSVRFFKVIPGVSWNGDYASGDSLYDTSGKSVVSQENSYLSSSYFFHLSALERSSRDFEVFGRRRKRSNHLLFAPFNHGKKLPAVTQIPEVFFSPRPDVVPDVTKKLTTFKSITNFFKKYVRI